MEAMWRGLAGRERGKLIKKAMRASAVVIQRAARANFIATGIPHARQLQQHIRVKIYTKNDMGFAVTLRSRPRKGTAGRQPNGRYAFKDQGFVVRFLEQGTADRVTGRGFNRGSVAPRGFFAKTRAQVGSLAGTDFQNNLTQAIQDYATHYGCTFS